MAKKQKQHYHYGTGRRKSSTARVFLKKGKGKITINAKDFKDYVNRETARMVILQPLEAVDMVDKFDVKISVRGGNDSNIDGRRFTIIRQGCLVSQYLGDFFLYFRWYFSDLIKVKRSTVCFTESLINLAFQFLLRNSPQQAVAVHRYQRPLAAITGLMDYSGGQLFAGSAFTLQHDIRTVLCHLIDDLVDLQHRQADAHQFHVFVPLFEPVF